MPEKGPLEGGLRTGGSTCLGASASLPLSRGSRQCCLLWQEGAVTLDFLGQWLVPVCRGETEQPLRAPLRGLGTAENRGGAVGTEVPLAPCKQSRDPELP